MSQSRALKNLLLVSAGLCALGLSGCSWVKEWPPREGQVRHNQAAAPTPPQSRLMQTADATWLAPAAQPETPVARMVPANGEELSTINRVRELEAEIAQLRNDMSMMLPAMTKMAETQSAMRDTLNAVVAPNAIAPQAGSPVAYDPAPMPLVAATPAAAPVTAALPTGPGISGIRFGDQNGNVRIVLDSQIPVSFRQELDPATGMLHVHLPSIGWQTLPQQNQIASPLVAGYSVSPDGAGGTNLAIQLRQPAQVTFAQALPPGGGKGDRVVIDLNPL